MPQWYTCHRATPPTVRRVVTESLPRCANVHVSRMACVAIGIGCHGQRLVVAECDDTLRCVTRWQYVPTRRVEWWHLLTTDHGRRIGGLIVPNGTRSVGIFASLVSATTWLENATNRPAHSGWLLQPVSGAARRACWLQHATVPIVVPIGTGTASCRNQVDAWCNHQVGCRTQRGGF